MFSTKATTAPEMRDEVVSYLNRMIKGKQAMLDHTKTMGKNERKMRESVVSELTDTRDFFAELLVEGAQHSSIDDADD